MKITHSGFDYETEDWLVIRTDQDGHQAVLITELWSEWLPAHATWRFDDDQVQAAVLARAIHRTPPEAWQALCGPVGGDRGQANGLAWCGRCARDQLESVRHRLGELGYTSHQDKGVAERVAARLQGAELERLRLEAALAETAGSSMERQSIEGGQLEAFNQAHQLEACNPDGDQPAGQVVMIGGQLFVSDGRGGWQLEEGQVVPPGVRIIGWQLPAGAGDQLENAMGVDYESLSLGATDARGLAALEAAAEPADVLRPRPLFYWRRCGAVVHLQAVRQAFRGLAECIQKACATFARIQDFPPVRKRVLRRLRRLAQLEARALQSKKWKRVKKYRNLAG